MSTSSTSSFSFDSSSASVFHRRVLYLRSQGRGVGSASNFSFSTVPTGRLVGRLDTVETYSTGADDKLHDHSGFTPKVLFVDEGSVLGISFFSRSGTYLELQ